jgi:hypothetical protein
MRSRLMFRALFPWKNITFHAVVTKPFPNVGGGLEIGGL